jgi:hypothetical protein
VGVPNTQAAPAVAEIFRKVRLELLVFIIVLGWIDIGASEF